MVGLKKLHIKDSCANNYGSLSTRQNKERKGSKKWLPETRDPLFIITLSMFLLFCQQALSIHWLIECGCFLFSLPCATENTLTRVRGRLIRQTVWVSWVGGRLIETDSEWQKALITRVLFKCVCDVYLDRSKILIKWNQAWVRGKPTHLFI